MKKIFILTILIVALLGINSCDRYLESNDPVRSIPDITVKPINLSTSVSADAVTLAWEVEDSTDISLFKVYVYDSTFIDQVDQIKPLKIYNIAAYQYEVKNLTVNQKYYFQVSAVVIGGYESEPSVVATARPSIVSININDKAEFTNNRNVQIQLSAPSTATNVILSEQTDFSDASFVSMSAVKSFTISEGDGVKTVNAKFKFSDGSESSGLISDIITLDTEVNIDSITFSSNDTIVTGDTIIFKMFANEPDGLSTISFTGSGILELYDDGTHNDDLADDGIYTTYYKVPVNQNLNQQPVTGNFTDVAGNRTSLISADLLQIYNLPGGVNLSALVLSTYEISLSWTQSTNSEFLAYRIYRSTVSPVDDNSELIVSLPGRGTTSYNDNSLEDGTTYFYIVYEVSTAGFSTASNEISAATEFNIAPEPVILSVDFQVDSTIDLSWTTSTADDFQYYTIFRAADTTAGGDLDSPVSLSIINTKATTNTVSIPPIGISYYQVFVYDRHNASAGSNIVKVER